jgi:hypothetical protein
MRATKRGYTGRQCLPVAHSIATTLLVLLLPSAVTFFSCAVPSKDNRSAVDYGTSSPGSADSGLRANKKAPDAKDKDKAVVTSPGTVAKTGVAGGETPVDKSGAPAQNPSDKKPGATPPGVINAPLTGKCVTLPKEQTADIYCGPYSAERRILCYAFASNKDVCLVEKPPDGLDKNFYDKLGERLVEHAKLPTAQHAPQAGDCKSSKVKTVFKSVRVLAEPSESATLVSDLAGSASTVTVTQLWGYWAKVKLAATGSASSVEGWIVARALACN